MDFNSPAALRKVTRELYALENDPPEGIRLILNEDSITDIQAWIQGPEGTPYAGGCFRLRIQLSPDFPNSPPKCYFMTKIFHPNVSKQGDVCVSTLKKDWKKELGLRHILLVVKCLLIVPNPESALNEEAGRQLLERYDDYAKHARLMTSIHAASAGQSNFAPPLQASGTFHIAGPSSDPPLHDKEDVEDRSADEASRDSLSSGLEIAISSLTDSTRAGSRAVADVQPSWNSEQSGERTGMFPKTGASAIQGQAIGKRKTASEDKYVEQDAGTGSGTQQWRQTEGLHRPTSSLRHLGATTLSKNQPLPSMQARQTLLGPISHENLAQNLAHHKPGALDQQCKDDTQQQVGHATSKASIVPATDEGTALHPKIISKSPFASHYGHTQCGASLIHPTVPPSSSPTPYSLDSNGSQVHSNKKRALRRL
ncbi:hypothetical protein BGZ75_000074 [Mortierella antarctica]|nr:hypothetical protein BGZ75_000074 [Mortierella antarctica]